MFRFSVDYASELDKCVQFIKGFKITQQIGNELKTIHPYLQMIDELENRNRRQIAIQLDDVAAFHFQEISLVTHIKTNTWRYISIFSLAFDAIIKEKRLSNINNNNENNNNNQDLEQLFEGQNQEELNVVDVLWYHRSKGGKEEEAKGFPDALRRKYEIVILPQKNEPDLLLRDVKAKWIGHLVSIRGIVTRVTEVKPLITVATYTCEQCGHEIFQEITSKTFMPLFLCPSEKCKESNHPGNLVMQTRGSKLVKYQEIKIQELAEQVPIGHIPRSLEIHAEGELTRKCSPGDIVHISGIFLPSPSGKRWKQGLLTDTYIEAMRIERFKKNYKDYKLSKDLFHKIQELAQTESSYSRLSASIAPEIFGHQDIKKALLLMMVGAPFKKMKDQMKIRGDINICLMGDPGVAKSQLLKHISVIAPRGVYTSGKGSSGVGLTAAVLRDPLTGDLVLEGGSLVLADKGICCIDEFDKMEDSDRTAIHEVMEQQTISIAKAGITTTLNARTAILAAANPAFGRYNIRKSPSENINLPAALLSRFDLLFLLLDKPDLEKDLSLARHITYVHRHLNHPISEETKDAFPSEFIRAYISQARTYNPTIPEGLSEYIVSAYVNMRSEVNPKGEYQYTTARTLLGILRLSSALARIRFDNSVTQDDIDEAMRLMHSSKISLLEEQEKRNYVDPISAIYDMVRNIAISTSTQSVKFSEMVPKILSKGYTMNQFEECLKEYEALGVLRVDSGKTEIFFL